MKKYLFMAVAAIAALSSCSSDNEVFNSEVKKALTFTATMESIGGDTRATLVDKSAKWEEGDEIYIMGVDASNNVTGASYVASGTNGTSTTFEPATPGQEVSGIMFQGFFPTYIAAGSSPEIPHEIDETWAEGKFNMPMFAMSSTTTLAFQNLCGVLAIKVNRDQLERVEFITISSSNRKLNGWIQPLPNGEGKLSGVALLYPEKDDEFDDLAIHYTSGVEIGEEGNVFYVPIPPSYNLDIDLNTRTMSLVADPYKDLMILINDGEGHIKTMTTKKDKEILIERNKIYNITFKDNSYPAGSRGTATAKINGEDVEVNWVQLWENGPKFAEYNVGATSASEYGGYYTWGGAYANGEGITWNDDHNEGTEALTGNDDTATKLWGSNWRMPTSAELSNTKDGLLYECDCTWTTNYNGTGVKGLLCKGKGAYSSNSVFLPAAGYCNGGNVDYRGDSGEYWSSTPNGNDYASNLYFDSGYQDMYYDIRFNGCSVRAVLVEE